MYLIPILSKTLDVLELLEGERQPLTLEHIHQRTRISKTTVFRILHTLVHRGYVSRPEDGRYRLVSRPRKLRFGFGAQSSELPFSNAVTASMEKAVLSAGVELIMLDNKYDPKLTRENVEEFIRQRVDIVVEFHTDHHVAPIIADRLHRAGIPLIAVELPHPHSTYFGVDNYRAGLEAGEVLGRHALERWGGRVDLVIGVDAFQAGTLVQSRMTGAFEGVCSLIPEVTQEQFVRVDGRGLRDESRKATLEALRRHSREKHILIAALNDTSALGALDAVRELHRERHVAIVGQDAIEEALAEMKKKTSPFIGSVARDVASYGPSLVELGLSILKGETVAPYHYADLYVVTRQNVHEVPARVLVAEAAG